jgi:uncharacterized membrane protein YfcA
VQAQQLQKAFGYFLLFMAAFIFWQNRHELRIAPTPKSPRVAVISTWSKGE